MRNGQRIWLTIGFVGLFALAIPWYWAWFPELATDVVLGFPVWVLASLVFSLAISVLIACALPMVWPDDKPEAGEER